MSLHATAFGQSERKYSFKMGMAKMVISILFALIGFCQTSFFGRFLPGFSNEQVRLQIEQCNRLQAKTVANYEWQGNQPFIKGIIPEFFSPSVESRLKQIVKRFLDDDSLEQELQREFGTSLRGVN